MVAYGQDHYLNSTLSGGGFVLIGSVMNILSSKNLLVAVIATIDICQGTLYDLLLLFVVVLCKSGVSRIERSSMKSVIMLPQGIV